MRSPPSVAGSIMDSAWFARALPRRLTFAVIALLLGILTLFPRHYLARAELLPQESGGGLSTLLGVGGGGGGSALTLGALLGSHQSIESDLAIARSQAVLRRVVARLHLARRGGRDEGAAEVALKRKIDIIAIRGSILQISAHDPDPVIARAIVSAVVDSVQDSLAQLSLEQSDARRSVATVRLKEATARLAETQAAVARFRQENRLASPEAELGQAVIQLANLQGRLQAKEVELQAARQFATDSNVSVISLEAEIAGLKHQIAVANSAPSADGQTTLSAMARQTETYFNLYRDERFAQTLYDIYTRYLEQVTVDEMASRSIMDVIEPPFVDPHRQYNPLPLGLLFLVVISALLAEFYVTNPPVGRRMRPAT